MKTIAYYDNHAQAFYDRTINADIADSYNKFLRYLPEKAKILDAGCGVGGDTKHFLLNGYSVSAFDAYRKMGVGSLLLDTAEKEAATRSKIIGIGVGLYAGEDGGYGAAQRLYVKRGYIPDGKGVTYNYEPTIPVTSYPLDDDLALWFTKRLSSV